MKLLLTGVTGVAGLAAYRAAVVDPAITHITVLSRRPIPSWAVLPPNASTKTTTIIHNDFLSYPTDLAKQLAQNDACVWALGRSVAGMNETDYTEMTYGYLLNAATALKDAGVGENRGEGEPFRFVFISGEHSDPTETSLQMWARVKGRAEKDLTKLCSTTPGMEARMFRPAYFFPPNEYPEDRKNQRPAWHRAVDIVMTPLAKNLIPSIYTPTEELGKFVVELAEGRWPEKNLFRNAEMRELMKATL
ncbi:uncharacterized protein C8Q71DRAFT_765049 [Rhodofomes roseus]|uniref:NAD(P)-binding domain-containing protein n=1 Tax=Rhodofomes roseus TaxID=34475 RepID=A0ABQ8KDV1_9APHY|nr:uncharacterized protein C8Q71DRAFT_765049 [Rhodofomes roseus]KAH9835294.1 hypothetical protein C8Q71DRAFT_765049 [Rhodofomes roseus]